MRKQCNDKELSKAAVIFKILARIIFRYVLTAVAAIMLIWFILPLFFHVCNIGNITGIIICTAYILWTSFSFIISSIIYFIRQKKVGKIVMNILTVFITVFVIYSIAASAAMAVYAQRKSTDTASTIVVLGCKVDDTHPSKSLQRRLEATYSYMVNNPECNCVVTGGKGTDEIMTEAQCMYNYLTDNGIDGSRIFMEDKATSTKENIIYSMALIKAKGLNENITIVTDGYHQLRANITAAKNNVKVSGAVSADTPLEVLPTYWIREWFAIPIELIRS